MTYLSMSTYLFIPTMGDSEGDSEYEGPRRGHTPFCAAEEGDMKRILAKTFKPALIASVPGSMVAVTTSLLHARDKQKYMAGPGNNPVQVFAT
jgi:hypothetical protein